MFRGFAGANQGCKLLTPLFAIFANDHANEIIDLHLGIVVCDHEFYLPMITDDITLKAANENDLP
ncbi:hypothetical protein DPMN_154780 [Dreissena polymorpha]|uniref:Uncharacterized protein n=1 Tax=Dreissena polymorpha TaxID=45954 RepID=A0A9D4FP59_DREPO|nr:hypothetical protein DPMN_154780 [Dreissena polymorpha]